MMQYCNVTTLLCRFRLFSTSAGKAALPPFGDFQKKLNDLFADPSKLPLLPHNITPQDMDSIDNDPLVRQFLLVDRNDTPQGVHFRRAVRHFAITYFCRRSNDTGSPEVQIALSTVRMAFLQRHLADGNGKHHKDYKTERSLKQVEAERKKMLKYLKRLDLERFYTMLDRLGLPSTFIEQNETRYPFNYRHTKEFKVPANRTIRPSIAIIDEKCNRTT